MANEFGPNTSEAVPVVRAQYQENYVDLLGRTKLTVRIAGVEFLPPLNVDAPSIRS